jgi:hypothetical protein
MDMNSGGGHKEPFAGIAIEAPPEVARKVFYARYGHDPFRVTCTCCGNDYWESEYETMGEVKEAAWKGPMEIIRVETITDEERNTVVPRQGYIWAD